MALQSVAAIIKMDNLIQKMPLEMEVYRAYTVHTLYTDSTVQTDLHCLHCLLFVTQNY